MQEKKINTNTDVAQFYCRNMIDGENNVIDGSTLKIGFWNNFFSLKLYPMLPSNMRNEKNIYDYKNNFEMANISEDKMYDLQRMIHKVLQHVSNNDYDFKPVNITSGKALLQISNGTNINLQKGFIYIVIFSGIQDDGSAQNMLVYRFNKSGYFEDYNYKTGEYNQSLAYEKEFNRFVKIVDQLINAGTKAYTHVANFNNQYRLNAQYKDFIALKEKLGIQSNSNSFSSNNFNNGYSSSFNGSGTTSEESSGEFIDGGSINDERIDL